MNTSTGVSSESRFAQAPLILQAYVVFAFLATVLTACVFFSPPLGQIVLPYAGWPGLSIYTFTLFFALSAVLTPRRRQLYSANRLLGLAMIVGAIDAIRHSNPASAPPPDLAHPSLIFNRIRPVFTVTLPALWLFLLMLPGVKRWVNYA